jgi:hypothetical protein
VRLAPAFGVARRKRDANGEKKGNKRQQKGAKARHDDDRLVSGWSRI